MSNLAYHSRRIACALRSSCARVLRVHRTTRVGLPLLVHLFDPLACDSDARRRFYRVGVA